jgi:hypothetical protein
MLDFGQRKRSPLGLLFSASVVLATQQCMLNKFCASLLTIFSMAVILSPTAHIGFLIFTVFITGFPERDWTS